MQLRVRVPKSLGLRRRIVDKYTSLYREYRRYYPQRKDYTYHQLRQNIKEVASIVHATIDSHEIHNATFIPWLDNDWKQFYFKHWYFALEIVVIDDVPTAIVCDAHYEGDHHNDILLSKPYDEEDLQKEL